MLRAIGAVIGGFVVWSILWLVVGAALKSAAPAAFDEDGMTSDTTVLGAALAASVVASLLSGFSVALIDRRSTRGAAMGLGVLLLAVGIAVQASVWSKMPLWYHLSFLTLLIPATLLGANLGTPGTRAARALA